MLPRAALEGLDLLADPARLFLAVPMADQADLFAALGLGPQRLAKPPGIGGDQSRGCRKNMRGRAVVLFQPDHRRAGKSFSNRRMLPTSAPRQP
jgi:hypothetical protein